MSFFKGREREGSGKKSQFYVEFLGWMECRGVRGRRYTDPVISELRRRQKKMDKPPKLTIQVSSKELKITQDFEEKKKRSVIKKIKFPAIPARDVTYAVQATRSSSDKKLDDVVACIYLGYMPRTQRYVHVHVYRFDEPSTAATFAKLMNGIVDANLTRVNAMELELCEKGEIEDPRLASSDGMSEHNTTHTGTDSAAGSGSSAYSEGGDSEEGRAEFGSDEMEADLRSLNDVSHFDSVAQEFQHRLKMGDGPILLPPKDYDTISRARGNKFDVNDRRCLNLHVVGQGANGGGGEKGRTGSEESGIDLASPSSDTGGNDVLNRFPPAYNPNPQQGGSRHSSGGNDSQSVYPPAENGYVYPPRQERGGSSGGGGGGGGVYGRPPPLPAAGAHSPSIVRHSRDASNTSSNFSTHSSRNSNDGNNSGGSDTYATPHAYRRSNSNNSSISGGGGGAVAAAAAAGGGNVFPQGGLNNSDFLPPDYQDEGDDSFHGPPPPAVAMRPKNFLARSASGGSRPGSGSNSPMLMRSLPASLMQSERALHSPRSPRSPRGGFPPPDRYSGELAGGGPGGYPPPPGMGGDAGYFAEQQRRSQPMYTSHPDVMDFRRPNSGHLDFDQGYGDRGVRRVNSVNR